MDLAARVTGAMEEKRIFGLALTRINIFREEW